MVRNVRLALVVGALSSLFVVNSANATTLTFDTDITQPNSSLAMDQTYGDRVTSVIDGNKSYGVGAEGFTPNVVASYAGVNGASGMTRYPDSYGDLVNVFENENDGENFFALTLTADAGFNVLLYGFEMAGWPTANYTIPSLSVFDGNNNGLFSQTNVFIKGAGSAPRHSTFDFSASPLIAGTLKIFIDTTGFGGNSDNIGIDNVRFGQSGVTSSAVPEPATWAMMLAGFGLVGATMRRKRQRAELGLA